MFSHGHYLRSKRSIRPLRTPTIISCPPSHHTSEPLPSIRVKIIPPPKVAIRAERCVAPLIFTVHYTAVKSEEESHSSVGSSSTAKASIAQQCRQHFAPTRTPDLSSGLPLDLNVLLSNPGNNGW